jgi:signal transduction histidine kinase
MSLLDQLVGLNLIKSKYALLVIIAVAAVILSFISYQNFTNMSDRITSIASEELRSNALIQVHDLSKILENRLQSTTTLLRTLADSPAIQNNEFQRAQSVINSRQNYTNELTDFYMWLNKDGKIVWISNMNSTAYQKYKGFDLSYRSYFTVPKNTNTAYYSSVIESNDKVPRLYISYPILSKQGPEYYNINLTKPGTFQGVAVTALLINSLGQLLKSQLFPDLKGDIGLLDNNGLILYANNQSYIGKSIFGKDSGSTMTSAFHSNSDSMNRVLKSSLQSGSCNPTDVKAEGGITNTFICAPVNVDGKHFLTIFLIAPHNLSADVSTTIDEQRHFSILIIATIAAVAIGISFIIFEWNRKLQSLVNSRTQELHNSNESLVESNKKLDIAIQQLELHDKMQKEFINVAAHELRTPIQPIIGLTEILLTRIKDNEQLNILNTVVRNSRRLHQLTEDILDITRIEGQTLRLNRVPCNINEIVKTVVEDNIARIGKSSTKKDLIIEYKTKEDQIIAEVDKGRITQVISNLIDNAIKFTLRGTINVTTEIINENSRRETLVSVKDSGAGIDPEIAQKLFSKFVTKSFTGTGLGLFISKNIIESHGGRIWAVNNDSNGGQEKGATFFFALPLPSHNCNNVTENI